MLVHKKTFGILEYAPWDGKCRIFQERVIPILHRPSIDSLELNPDEWWEIDDHCTLATSIRRHYPWFDPVIIDEKLTGIIPWPKWKIYGEKCPDESEEPKGPPKRKYRKGKEPPPEITFETIKKNYDTKLWKITSVKNQVRKGVITPEQFKEITGKDYE